MRATIQKILGNPDVVAAFIFCAAATVGQLIHAVKKWTEGYVWIMGDVRSTVRAVLGNAIGMLAFIQTGVLGPLMALPNGTFSLILFAFMQGFSADSGLNSGTKKVWTDEQRATAAADKKEGALP